MRYTCVVNKRVACVVGLLSVWTTNAVAQTPSGQTPGSQTRQEPSAQLQWNERDRGSDWRDVALLGVTGGVALTMLFVSPDREDPWRKTWGIDEDVRGVMRLTDAGDRRIARTTSDLLAGLLVTYPAVVEAGLNAAWSKSSPRVGAEMAMMHLQTLGLTAALVGVSKVAFSRERPYGRLCGSELSADSTDCIDDDRYMSFFSGHASFTFASASTICSQHLRWDLWGGTPAWIPCSTSYVLAATTALLRSAADRHYVTDIVTGAAVGTAIGWLIPWTHYRGGFSERGDVQWSLQANGVGFGIAGVF
jgi:hypothetical protein